MTGSAERRDTRRDVLRSAGVMTAMTLLSRVLGLVREQVRAIYLGTGAASDAFGLASTIPNLFRRLLAEGAMTAAFIPVFAEYRQEGREDATRIFLSRFVTLLTLVTVLVMVGGILVSPWLIETFFASRFQEIEGKVALTIILTQLMWPYLLMVTMASVLQALLNAHRIFGPSAFTPVLLNVSIILCGWGLAEAEVFPDPSYALVTGFLVGGVLQVGFQVPYLLRQTGIRFTVDFRFRDPGVRRVLLLMGPGVFAAGIYQINVFVSQLIASTLDQGSIASLQYSVRLQEVVLGLFVVSIAQVILPTLSDQAAAGDDAGVHDTMTYAMGLMAFVTLPSTLGLIMLGEPIVRLLFQSGAFDAESTQLTAYALTFHALGLLAIASSRVYQTVFYALKDMKTPTKIALVSAIVNVVLCVVLSGPLSHGGIALAGSVAAGVSALMLLVYLRRRMGELHGASLLSRMARMLLATLVMGGGLWGFDWLWPAAEVASRWLLLGWVLAALLVGVLCYVAACRLLRVDELTALWRTLTRRGRRDAGAAG